jgi:hypothetical protein
MNKIKACLPCGPVLGAALIAAAVAACAWGQKAPEDSVSKDKPRIAIERVPSDAPGEPLASSPIEGTVSGASPKDCKVVIYAYGDTWYVQPWAAAPYTKIGPNGKWKTVTHGGFEFAALLVKSSYRPPATLAELPEVGGSILAIARKKPEK